METVRKAGAALRGAETAAEELAAINALNETKLTAQEVYTFGVRLCDNQTDRDGEYFARADLEALAGLFVGKTGLFDHSWRARDQTARLYRTQIVEEPETVSEAGEAGCYLKGYAYLLRTKENEGLIREIEGGIKKEVSVSCAVRRRVCSVCGQEMGRCGHEKGQVYEGRRCAARLAEPTDAFEWSFVAVPAQPKAGVVLGKMLAQAAPEGAWREELDRLEKQAAAGRRYLDRLRRETVRLGAMAETGLEHRVLRAMAEKLDEEELEALRACYEKRLEGRLGLPVQLCYGGARGETTGDEGSFVI